MSGYKVSDTRLERLAAAITECQGQLRRCRETAGSLSLAVSDVLAELASRRVETHELKALVGQLSSRAEQARATAERVSAGLATVAIPERAGATDDTTMSRVRAEIGRLQAALAEADAECRQIAAELDAVSSADSAVAEARRRLTAADAKMRAQTEALELWLPDEAAHMRTDITTTLGELKRLAASETDSAAMREAADRLCATAVEVEQHCERDLLELGELQDADEQRMYTLRGLRHVCSRLGFKELDGEDGLRYEDGPRSAIVLTVDTRGRGRIVFRLTLDARVETESRVDPSYCPLEFGRLSDDLVATYGVQSRFTSPEQGPRPGKITKDAEDLPRASASSAG